MNGDKKRPADVTEKMVKDAIKKKTTLDSELADLEKFLDEFDANMEQQAGDKKPVSRKSDVAAAAVKNSAQRQDNSAAKAKGSDKRSQEKGETGADIFAAENELEAEFNQSLAEAGLLSDEGGDDDEHIELVETVEEADIEASEDDGIPVAMEAVELPIEIPPEEQQTDSARGSQASPLVVAEVVGQEPGRQTVVIGIVLLLVAIAVATGGIGMVLGLKSEVTSLQASLTELKEKSAQERNSTGEITQLRNELGQLQERIGDVATVIEGPLSHLQERSQAEFRQLSDKLVQMEQSLTEIKNRPVADPKPTANKAVAAAGGGEWIVNLVSLISKREANKQVEILKGKGINAVVKHARLDGKDWYRLQVVGFNSEDEARTFANKVGASTGFKNAWVGKE